MSFYQAIFRCAEGYGIVDLGLHPDNNSAILLAARLTQERHERGVVDLDISVVALVAIRNEFGEFESKHFTSH